MVRRLEEMGLVQRHSSPRRPARSASPPSTMTCTTTSPSCSGGSVTTRS
ncbi:hypothetical protein [Streptomyces sp. DSM 41033]